jgi:serine/threonine protein kinase
MEYADDGDLFQKIKKQQKNKMYTNEDEIWKIFIQCLRGLKALHDLHIMHRDLKSANVFLYKDNTAKLGDLNVSKVAKQGLGYTQTGTPYYASPEVWQDKPYDFKSDIWSLGCVLYESIALKPPFRADDMEGLYKRVLRGIYPKIPKHFSKDLSMILKVMLRVNPGKRPTCTQILNTNIISSRLNTLFPNELNETENILLQTIYVPKKLTYLTERLPKSTYEDHDRTEDETVISKYLETREERSSTLPKIVKAKNPNLAKNNRSVLSRKDSLNKSGKYSDYSYDSKTDNNDRMPAVSKSLIQRDTKNKHNHSIDTNESQIKSLALEYENIYSSKGDKQDKRMKKSLILKPTHTIPKNTDGSKILQSRTPYEIHSEKIPNLRNERESENKNLAESRNSSLVEITSVDQTQNNSKTHPKQRHQRLIDDRDKVSSILKILASSEGDEGKTERSRRKYFS